MKDNPILFVMALSLAIILVFAGAGMVANCNHAQTVDVSEDRWERVHGGNSPVRRLRIDGGWIYVHAMESFFVPECAP